MLCLCVMALLSVRCQLVAGPAEAATRKAKRRGHPNIEYEEEHEYDMPQQARLH